MSVRSTSTASRHQCEPVLFNLCSSQSMKESDLLWILDLSTRRPRGMCGRCFMMIQYWPSVMVTFCSPTWIFYMATSSLLLLRRLKNVNRFTCRLESSPQQECFMDLWMPFLTSNHPWFQWSATQLDYIDCMTCWVSKLSKITIPVPESDVWGIQGSRTKAQLKEAHFFDRKCPILWSCRRQDRCQIHSAAVWGSYAHENRE